MSETQTQTPDEASQWYRERQGDTLREVEAKLNELAGGYDALQNTWNALDEKEEAAHSSLDTKEIVRIQKERARIEAEAAQIQQGYAALNSEKARLEANPDPNYADILNGSSEPSKMFLRVHRAKLENNPAEMRRLLFAHARATASGLKADSPNYFKAIEASLGFDSSDRNLDDFREELESAEQRASKTATKRDTPEEFKPTEAQREMAREMAKYGQGQLTEQDYLKSCAKPFSQAAEAAQHIELPDSSDSGNTLEVKLEPEKPTRKTVDPAKYRAPDPKTSATLNPVEVDLVKNMASVQNRSFNDVAKEFAIEKLKLHSGKSHYQLYQDKLASEGHR